MDDFGQTGMVDENNPPPPKRRWWLFFFTFFTAIVVFFALVFVWATVTVPPVDFPKNKMVIVPPGVTLNEVAELLSRERLIRSRVLFVMLVRLCGAEEHVVAGEYLFSAPIDLPHIVRRLTRGEHGISRLRVVIPEGTSIVGMGKILSATFSRLDKTEFTARAQKSEGYLFPDTYFFFSTATSGPVIDTLKNNFLTKTDSLRSEALLGKKNWADIISMASIIEEEAKTPKDRRIISGILWKRLAKGMRLQVDAPFAYAIGKNSATLTTVDLKYDSPYNTYLYGGLPPTPITNPGLDAIDASVHPETSPYFFYLSDKEGVIHYAKTFEEHKLNKARYIR